MSKVLTPEELLCALNKLPRVPLADLPTPIHDCPRLAKELGMKQFLMKRDDLTGLAFGGNKTRKFDYTFGDALKQGADVVITGAASQSNHARQAAAAAAKLGLKCYLVNRLDHRARLGIQGNFLLDCLLGAEVRLVAGDFQAQAKEQLADELRAKGHKPYIIGDFAAVLGAAAYAGCVAETIQQLKDVGQASSPDSVVGRAFLPDGNVVYVLASGHGTQAGIVLGVNALGLSWRVEGFRPSNTSDDDQCAKGMIECANEAAEVLGILTRLTHDDIRNTADYVGKAYGYVTDAALDAIELVARTEGILLDPVYTAKAMAGVIDYIRTGRINEDATIIYLHTGGAPALFAYAPELVEHGKYRGKIVERLEDAIL